MYPGYGPEWNLPPFKHGQPIRTPAPWNEFDLPSYDWIAEETERRKKLKQDGNNPQPAPRLAPSHKTWNPEIFLAVMLALCVGAGFPLGWYYRRQLRQCANKIIGYLPRRRRPPRYHVPYTPSELDTFSCGSTKTELSEPPAQRAEGRTKQAADWEVTLRRFMVAMDFSLDECDEVVSYFARDEISKALSSNCNDLVLEPDGYTLGDAPDIYEPIGFLPIQQEQFVHAESVDPISEDVAGRSLSGISDYESRMLDLEKERLRLENERITRDLEERRRFDAEKLAFEREKADREYQLMLRQDTFIREQGERTAAAQEAFNKQQIELREREISMGSTAGERWGQVGLQTAGSVASGALFYGAMRGAGGLKMPRFPRGPNPSSGPRGFQGLRSQSISSGNSQSGSAGGSVARQRSVSLETIPGGSSMRGVQNTGTGSSVSGRPNPLTANNSVSDKIGNSNSQLVRLTPINFGPAA
nr:52K protein [Rice stripe necrosis virus]QUW17244.1 52K [Rice stripe necrosis virus]